MSDTTRPTRLDAINTMLAGLGEAPVASIEGTNLTYDVQIAKNTLSECLKQVLGVGWHFNTDYDYLLTPDVNKNIFVPADAASVDVDPMEYPDIDPVIRGNRLYDRKSQGYNFTSPIKAKIIWLIDFEELPQAAQYYITLLAARTFQARVMGSDSVNREASQAEFMAMVAMKQDDDAQSDRTIFDSWSIANTLMR